MPDQFFQDKKSMKVLKAFYKKAPKAFQRVSAGTLNGLAFSGKQNFAKSISRNMTIRSPGLLKKLIGVKTTSKSRPISKQESRTFTKTMPRHEGWEATARGGQAEATKFSDKGRVGGNQAKPAQKQAREGRAYTEPSDVGFSNRLSKKRVVLYLQRISQSKSRRRKSFLLPVWYKKIEPGIYRWVGGSVKRRGKKGRKTLIGAKLIRLSTPGEVYRVRDYDWQNEADEKTMEDSNIKVIWVSNFNHELKKVKIK